MGQQARGCASPGCFQNFNPLHGLSPEPRGNPVSHYRTARPRGPTELRRGYGSTLWLSTDPTAHLALPLRPHTVLREDRALALVHTPQSPPPPGSLESTCEFSDSCYPCHLKWYQSQFPEKLTLKEQLMPQGFPTESAIRVVQTYWLVWQCPGPCSIMPWLVGQSPKTKGCATDSSLLLSHVQCSHYLRSSSEVSRVKYKTMCL